jgi:hypothetical protein
MDLLIIKAHWFSIGAIFGGAIMLSIIAIAVRKK